jgi:glycosyltransferase involved in cell wall biosynthesis
VTGRRVPASTGVPRADSAASRLERPVTDSGVHENASRSHNDARTDPSARVTRRAARVSVVIPLYNKARSIDRTIRSILAQTVSDFEIIVVDDGSTDEGPMIVEGFHDSRIVVVRQANLGEGAARNRGIRTATSDLVAFCDADDEWMPTFLETIFILERKFPTCAVFATAYLMREPGGRRLAPPSPTPTAPYAMADSYFSAAAKYGTPWCASSVAVRRDAILSTGGFPTNAAVGADLLAWARLAARYSIATATVPQAIFDLRGPYPARPVRTPDVPDVVGAELHQMVRSSARPRRRAMRRYVGAWHRARAKMYLYHGRRSEVVGESLRSLRFAPFDWRVYLIAAFALLPRAAQDRGLRIFGRRKAAHVVRRSMTT